MYYGGILLAFVTFMLIGVFHPIVIKTDYYLSTKCWPVFALLGTACVAASLFIQNIYISSVIAVLGACFLWSILVLFAQRKRVIQGRFPKNPNRSEDYYR